MKLAHTQRYVRNWKHAVCMQFQNRQNQAAPIRISLLNSWSMRQCHLPCGLYPHSTKCHRVHCALAIMCAVLMSATRDASGAKGFVVCTTGIGASSEMLPKEHMDWNFNRDGMALVRRRCTQALPLWELLV